MNLETELLVHIIKPYIKECEMKKKKKNKKTRKPSQGRIRNKANKGPKR